MVELQQANLLALPPLGPFDIVMCRNVLIYFDNDLKDRVLGLFRDSLAHRGFLGLGAKESVRFSAEAASFADFVREEKIYQRVTP